VCWFVTVGVPQAARQKMESIAQAHRPLQFTSLAPSPTVAVFPVGTSCIEVTHGGCSCDLYSAPRQRLERKGWSASKIKRALETKATGGARTGRPRESAVAFKAFVAELIATLGSVDLFAHFYSGNQHEQAVGSPKAAAINLRSFVEAGFPADTVTTVRAAD
jgi:hypothetical protein